MLILVFGIKRGFFMQFILIKTDGYTIQHRIYSSLSAAVKEMQSQYNEAIPNGGLLPDWKELSYINDNNAILYANGENVYVWKIIIVG